MTEVEQKEWNDSAQAKISALNAVVGFFACNFEKLNTKAILLHELESLAIDARAAGFDDFTEDVKLLIVNRVNAI